MSFSRRIFLQKTALASVLGSMISVPTLVFSTPAAKSNLWIQIGGKVSRDLGMSLNEMISSSSASQIILSTGRYDKLVKNDFLSKADQPLCLNFDPKILAKSESEIESIFVDSSILMVNSNLNLPRIKGIEQVKKSITMDVAGEKHGVIGISFSGNSQSISSILALISERSEELKGQGCKKIVCLLENPEERFPYLDYRDFVESSKGVDWFFTNSKKAHDPRLYTLKNSADEQVLLQVHFLGSELLGVVEEARGNRKLDFLTI